LCECLQTYFLQKELKVAGDTPILDHQLANLRTLRLSRNGWGCSVLCSKQQRSLTVSDGTPCCESLSI
ncbi:MAG: hypothetical protein ACRCUJ_02860, partial [Phocaeicola sp.]